MNSPRNMKNRTFNKPRDKKSTIKKLWTYLSHYKLPLLFVSILTILSNLFSLLGPLITGYAMAVIEKGKGHVDFDELSRYIILLFLFYGLSSVLSFFINLTMIKISKKVVYKLRKDCFNKLLMLHVSYFDTEQIGDIISKMSYDIDTVNTSLSSDLVSIVTSIITVFGSLFMMLIIAPILVLVFVLTIPVSLVFTRLMLKKTHKLFSERSRSLGVLNGYVEEMITGNKVIKAYGREYHVIDGFDELNNKACNCAYKAEYYSSITGPGVNFVNNLSLALVSFLGAFLYIFSRISLKEISSFVLYSRKFSGPINEMANIFTDIESSLAACERVFSILNEEIEPYQEKSCVNFKGEVEVSHVNFGYTNKPVLKDISFNASPGEVIAICGKTGSGKTTIVNLLMRFYDVNNGNICLDKNNIYTLSLTNLRSAFTMVLQDTWLFEGSVLDNIRYANPTASLDECIKACIDANIHDFIMNLPNGYDTILTEDGSGISKGQKQLLTIARAMLVDAKMLILDEATSNVDILTEVKIQDAMKRLMKGKTCFIIAHRLSTIRNADKIIVIKDGEIIEVGRHEDLIRQKGYYYTLYNSQFE